MADATLSYEGRAVTFHDVDEKSHIGNCLLNVGWYENLNLDFIRSLNVGGNYVDIGAHIGTHALFFALFCNADRVFAFEPQRAAFQHLMTNVAKNKAWKCLPFQVALLEADEAFMPPDAGEHFVVRALDSFALRNVKLMKVDTENSEFRVLRGATQTLRSVDHLFVEIWPREVCDQYHAEYLLPPLEQFLAPYGLQPQGRLPLEDLFYFGKIDMREKVKEMWKNVHGTMER